MRPPGTVSATTSDSSRPVARSIPLAVMTRGVPAAMAAVAASVTSRVVWAGVCQHHDVGARGVGDGRAGGDGGIEVDGGKVGRAAAGSDGVDGLGGAGPQDHAVAGARRHLGERRAPGAGAEDADGAGLRHGQTFTPWRP